MYFMIYAVDRPEAKAARARLRGEHRRFMRSQTEFPVTVHAGGPLFAEDGTTMIGSLMLVEADDIATVRRYMQKVPYHAAKLYESVVLRPYGWSVGAPSQKK